MFPARQSLLAWPEYFHTSLPLFRQSTWHGTLIMLHLMERASYYLERRQNYSYISLNQYKSATAPWYVRVPTPKETRILTTTDHLLSRRYPLGLRMGQIRRRLRLHPLRPRSHCSRRSLAHTLTPNRIRPHLTILRLHLPLLRRRTSCNQRPSTTLVHYIPVHSHFRGRSKHCPQPNWPRTDCR